MDEGREVELKGISEPQQVHAVERRRGWQAAVMPARLSPADTSKGREAGPMGCWGEWRLAPPPVARCHH